ncbi:hypothetical protein Tco_1319696 [Tanacetum coccineum]
MPTTSPPLLQVFDGVLKSKLNIKMASTSTDPHGEIGENCTLKEVDHDGHGIHAPSFVIITQDHIKF